MVKFTPAQIPVTNPLMKRSMMLTGSRGAAMAGAAWTGRSAMAAIA